MRSILKNKRGGYTDIFIFMIVAVVVVFISVLFIYMSGQVKTKLHEKLDNLTEDDSAVNYSKTIDETIGVVETTYASLYWISIFLIFGMIIAIFIGSYMVQTKPVYFVPYIFICIIAIIVAVGLANAYDVVMQDATLSSTFAKFTGANFILLHLPIWVAVISITGGIIMFVSMQKGQEIGYYG